MTATDTWTIGRLLTWTTDYLKEHGSDSPRLDAEILLAHARDCQRIQLYTAFEEEPTEETRTAFREMVRRRAEGTPVAYLVGYKEFYSASFEVNPDVLIPRPETEHLVLEAIDQAKAIMADTKQEAISVVDVGTGSGIVAITLAKHIPAASVLAIDISPAAIDVGLRNAERNEVTDERIEFAEGDLLSDLQPDQQFDLIVSNPPYVSDAEYEALEKGVREFEPKSALVAGPEGYELIVKLLSQSEQHLAPDGLVLIEMSPMLADQVATWIPSAWEVANVVKDLAGHARVLTFRRAD